MYISELKIENFRLFGSADNAFVLALQPGLTALIGENDAGKTAVIDALRLVLGTRDQETVRIDEADFHQAGGAANPADFVRVRLEFRGLTSADRATFVEFLTYREIDGQREAALIVTWHVRRNADPKSSRRVLPPEWRTGSEGSGALLDLGARSLLTATYLRPLRDAERALSAGRGSRLSQILQHTGEVKSTGVGFDIQAMANLVPSTLSLLGVGDYANYLIGESQGVKMAAERLNKDYLSPLSFVNSPLSARMGMTSGREDEARLRLLLEKFEVALSAQDGGDGRHARGLGSNNLLFMACELLLLATESDGFPLLLIEEPEAHLHPQRQLRLMSFLQQQVERPREDGQSIQVIVTTHSAHLASDLKLDNVVLIDKGRAFPLCEEQTKLHKSDYRFLERFLDVTKANLFFARAVFIVEGDAENILLPVISRLLGRDFHAFGVSIVNVGGVGLGRYARIFMRREVTRDEKISIPVACITDLDVMPNDAPWIVGKLKEGEPIPPLRVEEEPVGSAAAVQAVDAQAGAPGGTRSRRKWRVLQDFRGTELEARRTALRHKASEQNVDTFVADHWTLEYDLAYYGLGEFVFVAACLALADEKIHEGKKVKDTVVRDAKAGFKELAEKNLGASTTATHVYAKFEKDGASKAVAAQYLAELLEEQAKAGQRNADELRVALPPYLVRAIAHVTGPFEAAQEMTEAGEERREVAQ